MPRVWIPGAGVTGFAGRDLGPHDHNVKNSAHKAGKSGFCGICKLCDFGHIT